jgi:hypothetical protein
MRCRARFAIITCLAETNAVLGETGVIVGLLSRHEVFFPLPDFPGL